MTYAEQRAKWLKEAKAELAKFKNRDKKSFTSAEAKRAFQLQDMIATLSKGTRK